MASVINNEAAVVEMELQKLNNELESMQREINVLLDKQHMLHEKRKRLKNQLKSVTENEKQNFNAQSESFSWSSRLSELQSSIFKVDTLRPLQLETMNTTMDGQDCMLIMPTGGGKSLCYQLPALLSAGLTLVISPLVSLMEDQTMALERLGIQASMITAATPKEKVSTAFQDMIKTPCRLKLLYVTPERIAKSKRFMNKLEQCQKAGLLSRIAIDEVHCCSQWGHDFRPDYKILGILKRQFPKVPILGLTATASNDVMSDLLKILGIPYAQVLKASFNRKNLTYKVLEKPATHKDCIGLINELIQEDYKGSSGIIYCFSRKDTETVAADLRGVGLKCAAYHGDLSPHERSNVHVKWSCGRIQVIVATVAFGMGIDKPDVRFVIHHSLSKSMENYYQESGRAGRDGQRADCILLFRLADVFRQSCMVFTEQTGLMKLYSMVKYCLSFSQCRRQLIAVHFSEVWENLSCDGMCDFCSNALQSTAKQFTDVDMVEDCSIVINVLNLAKSKDIRVTGLKLLDAMQGKGPLKLRPRESANLTGIHCEYLIAHMLMKGYLREDFHFTPYSTISYLLPGAHLPHHLFVYENNKGKATPKPNNIHGKRLSKRKNNDLETLTIKRTKDEVIILDSDSE